MRAPGRGRRRARAQVRRGLRGQGHRRLDLPGAARAVPDSGALVLGGAERNPRAHAHAARAPQAVRRLVERFDIEPFPDFSAE